jgi:uncharacterized protein (DUF983 family)
VVHGGLHMAEVCPGCGHHFERQEGYWLGAVAINTVATLGLFTAALVIAMAVTWPDVPWTALTVGGAVLCLVFPIVFYPLSKTLWVALETAVHPAGSEPP